LRHGLRLRFPGQQFEAETGTHYNYFRDYEAGTGRYLQSDPMGLFGGINGYSYADLQPTSFSDRYGLIVTRKTRKEVLDENCNFFGKATCECCGMDLIPSVKSKKGVTPPENEIQYDHIKPASKDGGDDAPNIQILARICNRKKSNNDDRNYKEENRAANK
jgi:RHS repeat-associated protein